MCIIMINKTFRTSIVNKNKCVFIIMIELEKALGVDDDVAAKKLVGRVSSFPEKAMALDEIV